MYNVATHNSNSMIFYSEPDAPHFVLMIDPSDSSVALFQEVRRHCAMFVSEDDPWSRAVVRAAADIAGRRGVKAVYFTDYSYMSLTYPDQIDLADLSFLTTGQTWYESILSPVYCISPEGENMEHYRHLARTNTWRQVGHGLVDVDIPHIDIDASGSAMEMLNYMKKDGGFLEFFAKNMCKLLRRSGIHTLSGTDWVYNPKDDPVAPPPPTQNQCSPSPSSVVRSSSPSLSSTSADSLCLPMPLRRSFVEITMNCR
jgi:hypothetical protein